VTSSTGLNAVVCFPAVDALSAFAATITNLLALQEQGLKGWGGASNPCAGWTGITCNEVGRVTVMCALTFELGLGLVLSPPLLKQALLTPCSQKEIVQVVSFTSPCRGEG
jgi:hypothetical protein